MGSALQDIGTVRKKGSGLCTAVERRVGLTFPEVKPADQTTGLRALWAFLARTNGTYRNNLHSGMRDEVFARHRPLQPCGWRLLAEKRGRGPGRRVETRRVCL